MLYYGPVQICAGSLQSKGTKRMKSMQHVMKLTVTFCVILLVTSIYLFN